MLNRYPSLFHGTPEFVSIPKTWDTNRIGTVVSHTLRNGLNYLWLEAIYSKMAVVHNSNDMLECGYYYDDFNVTDAKLALYDAVHNHDARFSEQMEKRAACLHKIFYSESVQCVMVRTSFKQDVEHSERVYDG